jgi:Uma2 family endonuclease
MSTTVFQSKKFRPGTSGWSIDDLEDPEVERAWERNHFEIVEGVLTKMPAAMLEGSWPLSRLCRTIQRHLEDANEPGEFAYEVDFIVNRLRVAKVDALFITPDVLARQQVANKQRGGRSARFKFGRLVVPPLLAIESVSIGHEDHDRVTKRQWYADARIPNYWILDAFKKSLECLVLDGASYRCESLATGDEIVTPSLVPKLFVDLGKLWM